MFLSLVFPFKIQLIVWIFVQNIFFCSQAFLEVANTQEFSGEPMIAHSLDLDRMYRVLAHSLNPYATPEMLREFCTDYDISCLNGLLNRIATGAKDLIDHDDNLATMLRIRMAPTGNAASTEPCLMDIPPGPLGATAHTLACVSDVNPLRLRPQDLLSTLSREERPENDGNESIPLEGATVVEVHSLDDWLIDWLFGLLIHALIDWLLDCLPWIELARLLSIVFVVKIKYWFFK